MIKVVNSNLFKLMTFFNGDVVPDAPDNMTGRKENMGNNEIHDNNSCGCSNLFWTVIYYLRVAVHDGDHYGLFRIIHR